jgi:hypothetical protein
MPLAATSEYLPATMQARRARYEALRASLVTERSSFDSHWREIGDFLLPRRTRFYASDRNKGDKRNQNIIDSTARFSLRTLQSGLHAGLTSPARPWMKLTTTDPELAKFPPVKAWLHIVTQRMLDVFLGTNLYNALPMLYGDFGMFATASMAVVDDDKDLFRCYPYPTGSFALGVNRRGLVSTFVREYELTVRQVIEEFGLQRDGRTIDWSTISLRVRNLWDKGNYEAAVALVWLVKPNDDARPERLEARYKRFVSCHYEQGADEGKLLRESGFDTFPILAPRWDVTGEDTYGTDCPGMTALGDIKQLQLMQRRKGQAIHKMIDPPLVGPNALRGQKTSLLPGDITYVDTREGQGGLRSIHEVRLDLSHLTVDIGQVQYRIQRAFYEDLFLMLAHSDRDRGGQPVTAREIDERHEEKLLALGPVLERTNDELLDPLVDRVFAMMLQAGLIPEPPDALAGGQPLKVEYISIMAQAQKLVGVVGQDRFLQSTIALFEAFPEARHKVVIFQAIDNYGDMLGVDPRIVRSTEDAEALQSAEAQAQQEAAAAEQAKSMGAAIKSAGSTPMGGDTALNRIVESAA